jgi:hypothetical protein
VQCSRIIVPGMEGLISAPILDRLDIMISIRFFSSTLIGAVLSVGIVSVGPAHTVVYSVQPQIAATPDDGALDPLPATFGEQASQGLSAVLAGN